MVEEGKPAATPPNRGTVALVVGLLLALGLAAYWNSLRAPFVYDDADTISGNASIRHLWPLAVPFSPPGGGKTVSGRPVLNLSFAVNYALGGESVWGYHLTNLGIHVLAACALFGLVRATLRLPRLSARFRGSEDGLAAAIAGVWLLHPLQTESVTYTSQRAESLAGFLILLVLYAFVRGCSSQRPRSWFVLAFVSLLLAAGTKEIAAVVPALVFLFDRSFVAGSFAEAWRRRWGLYFALLATWIPQTIFLANTGWTRGGTVGFGMDATPVAYWLTQPGAVLHYIGAAFWPHPLVFDHGPLRATPAQALIPFLVLCLLLAGSCVALSRNAPAGCLGVAFLVLLAPTSLVPGTNQMIVEHRTYLPLVPLISFTIAGLFLLGGRRTLLVWPAVVVLFAWLVHARNADYASERSLWLDTARKAPANPRAHYSLGIADTKEGRFEEAVEQDREALQWSDATEMERKGPAYYNKLGLDLSALGRTREAVASYEGALREHPDYVFANLNIARALVRLDRGGEAVAHYENALAHGDPNAQVEAELAGTLMQLGDIERAVVHWEAATRLAPGWAQGFNSLGYAQMLAGHPRESESAYRSATRLEPSLAAAWAGLAYAMIEQKRPSEAIGPCAEAIRLQPQFSDAYNTLGIAYGESGQPERAAAAFRRALALGATTADVHNNLGNALSALGQPQAAVEEYRKALAADPSYLPAKQNLQAEVHEP